MRKAMGSRTQEEKKNNNKERKSNGLALSLITLIPNFYVSDYEF